MSTFFGGAWNSLKFDVTSGVTNSAIRSGYDAASSLGFNYVRGASHPVTYKNNRAYKVILAHVVKREAMQIAEAEINKLFPKFQRYLEKTLRESVLKQQDANYVQLIKNQQKQVNDNEWGSVKMSDGTTLYAHDKYGAKVPEALMLYYDGDDNVVTTDVKYREIAGRVQVTPLTVTSKTLLFIDLAPRISCNSAKNIVMTTVQGRDYTRKELVSGGDLKFSVNGTIVNDEAGVYPETQVQKLVQMCQYGGVIKVNHYLFKQFNVNQIIITDYSFGESDYKNEQPYTLSCVAVEPDEDIKISRDTLAILNNEIQVSPMNKWYKLILDNKLAEMAANAATSIASSIATTSLDILTTDKI